jgi:hypothetical protein
MLRHLAPLVGGTLALVVGLAVFSGRAEAQVGTGSISDGSILNDPFQFYYSIYLPNQMATAMRPQPGDTINNALVNRQYFTQLDRGGLYNPTAPYAQAADPLQPYSGQQERLARPARYSYRPQSGNGTGPSLYFNRVAEHFPGMANRTGRNRNANVASRRSGGRGMGGGMGAGMGGGMGMGSAGGGMF